MGKMKTTAMRRPAPKVAARGALAWLVETTTRLIGCVFLVPSFLRSFFRSSEQTTSKRARRWPSRVGRLVRILLVAVRMIVAVTAVQITGIPHVVADAVAAVQGDDRHEECPNDEDGRECPPGCPSCHCAHPMNALPAVPPPMELDFLIPIEVAIAPYEAQAPPGPDLASLYRPPRCAVA